MRTCISRAYAASTAAVLVLFALVLPGAASAQTPGQVANPAPPTGAAQVPITTALSWSAAPNATRYDVRLGTTTTPPIVERNVNATSYQPASPLTPGTTYYWRIDARGRGNAITNGPLWSFTTAAATPPPVSTSLDRLRLMTWNIRRGTNAAGTTDIDAQVELMADSGAHVIVLQDATVTSAANLPDVYKTKLQSITGKTWYAIWAPAPTPSTSTSEGNLILTYLPPASSSTIQIDSAPGDPNFLDGKRSAAQVGIIVDGVLVNVFVTRLAEDPSHRQAQLDTLQSWLSTFPERRLIGGDFNAIPGDGVHTDMAALFTDTWSALAPGDPGFTKDSRNVSPSVPGRIDYWWQEKLDASARATEVWVVKTKRSDHHALLIDVDVR